MFIRGFIVGFGAVICLTIVACVQPVSGLFEAATVGDRGSARSNLKKGANVNATPTGSSWTPLHLAANEGSEATCRCLLDGGADLYARNNAGETPLQLAEGHVDTERIMQDFLARDPG